MNENVKKKDTGDWKSFMAFFRHAKISWGWVFIALVVNIVYYQTVTKLPGSTAALFAGKFTKGAIMGVITNYSLVMIYMGIVMIVILIAEAKSVRNVRKAVWQRMMGIESSYYDRHGANSLFSAVTSDSEIAVATLVNVVVSFPGLLSYLIKALPMINSFSPKLMWSVLVLIPVYILYAVFMGRWQYKTGYRIQMKIGGLTGFLSDRIRNLTMIKTFTAEEKEEEKGIMAAKELHDANIEYSYVNAVVTAYTMGIEVLGIIIAVIWGCALLRSQEINLENWLAFYLFVPTINTVLRQLTNIWASFKEVQGRAARLGALMEAPQEEMSSDNNADIMNGDIHFDHVTFSYTEDTQLLRDLSFTIPQGKTTAVVGYCGSGKTTILKLIERLYTSQSGDIRIADQSLNTLNLTAWRKKLSYVSQEAALFSGTIKEALCYGHEREISEDELISVTKQAGIYDFIMAQPNGFDCELAIWGSAMSGGQRQRMVIARELLKNADIILLDEPTSALDAETANAICDTFFNSFKDKTIITVTHEIGFVTNADQIIVLKNGVIEGVGKHGDLYETCPLYRELTEEQSFKEVLA